MTCHPRLDIPDPLLAAQPAPYDPWHEVGRRWPQTRVVIEPMPGDLLGEVRDGGAVIALRAGTSAAQRRCTLTHELVHLERGLRECGPWLDREERQVHAEVARRLIPLPDLIGAIRTLGGAGDPGALAPLLDVDGETMAVRLTGLTSLERTRVRRGLSRQRAFWSVA